MVVPKINSAHGSDTRNIINAAIDLINAQGKSLQDLVAKGQLTPTQYATLLQAVNGLISKGSVTLDDLSPEVIALLQESDPDFTLLSIPRDRSVTPEKTTMFNNNNLYDKNSLTLNRSFDESGNIINDTLRGITDFIPVEPFEQLSITPMSFRIVYYDENKNKVSTRGGTSGGNFQVYIDDNIRFIRLSGVKEAMLNGDIMMNRGTTLLPYEDFGLLKRKYIPEPEDLLSEDIMNRLLPETIIKTNLFDGNRLKFGNITSSGAVVDSTSLKVTDYFMDVNGGSPYTFTVGALSQAVVFSWKVAYYDESGTHIITHSFSEVPGDTSWTLDAPKNAKTALVCATVTAVDTFTVVIGEDPYKSSDEGKAYNEIWDIIGNPKIEDGSITEKLLNEDVRDRLLPETIIKTNLFDANRLKLGNITSIGVVVPSGSIMVTDYYIEVTGGKPYTFTVGALSQAVVFSWKVAYYDESGTNIITQDFSSVPGNTSWTLDAPENAKTALVCATTTATDTFTMVIGNSPYKSSDEGEVYDNGIWDIISKPKLEDESIEERHLSPQLLNKISSGVSVNKKYPNPARMNFEVFTTESLIPLWLDKPGEIMYLHTYNRLKQTTDDFETVENIGVSFDRAIKGMRILSDGELLVTVSRDESVNAKATAYKSVNYDSSNPADTTFKLVHSATGEASDFYNRWGLDVYDNIVLLGEYGVKNGTGARRVYLSTDNAETFKEIFWQETVYAAHGIPYDAATAHVHTVKYDPYFNRIWIVCGDGINTGTFYSDDLGKTWNVVKGSTGATAVQYTGIAVLPDCVVFGSDRSPNGLHIFERSLSKSDEVTIRPWAIINNHEITSHIFQMAFQRDVGEPYYFGSGWDIRAGVGHAVIMSFINKDSVQTVFETPMLPDGTKSPAVIDVIGATKSGYVYTSWHDEVTWNIARAKAPVWESV